MISGNRSLKDNLGGQPKTTTIDPLNVNQSLMEVSEDDDEIPDRIEEIIEILLNGLRNKVNSLLHMLCISTMNVLFTLCVSYV